MRRTWTILAALAALLAFAPAARAETYTVTATADIAGACEAASCTSIRAALAASGDNPGPDIVDLPAGTYQLSSGALALNSAVTLRGAGARTTVIEGNADHQSRVLDIGAFAVTVARVTIRGGGAPGGSGGNILATGATVVLDRVRVANGAAASGGGIAAGGGSLAIESSLIDNNAASGDGGGILNASNLTLQNSTVAFNTAGRGGGIVSSDASSLVNVTVAHNQGGGVHLLAGTNTARSTIVAANTAAGLPSNCAGATFVSTGFNVDEGRACGFTQETDRESTPAALEPALRTYGEGETDVILPAPSSPAVNLHTPSTCGAATDQVGGTRPKGPTCDAGAVELEYDVRIDSGPAGAIASTDAAFTFSSSRSAVSFECALDSPAFGPCPATYSGLSQGPHTFRVQALVGGAPIGEASRAFTVDTIAPVVTITSGPPRVSNVTFAVFEFTASEAGVTYECIHTFPDASSQTVSCESGWFPYDFFDGEHRFEIVATDAAGNHGSASATVLIDTTLPEAVEPSQTGAATFAFGPGEDGTVFECRLEPGAFVPCTSPVTFEGLEPGDYTFTLQTIDVAGNRAAQTRSRTFSIAAPPAAATAAPEAVATPRPVATPTPTPQAGKTVVARPVSGRILVKRPNSAEFVELRGSSAIPVDSEVNAKNGRVALTIEPGNGMRPQRAVFYAGIFKLSQPGATLDLTLSEPLAPCKKRGAAAQSLPTSRKLWGDGKGKFRTKGRHSSSAVRGTIWLVQDSCEGTLTRVRQGVVSVRDSGRRKTVLLRAGRSYLAKPRRR